MQFIVMQDTDQLMEGMIYTLGQTLMVPDIQVD